MDGGLFTWKRSFRTRCAEIYRDVVTRLQQSLRLEVPSVSLLISPAATETRRLYGSRALLCEFLPDHKLIPTFFHCRIDSTASVYLEAGSWSSERPRDRQMWANWFYMLGVTMVKLKENMLSVTTSKYGGFHFLSAMVFTSMKPQNTISYSRRRFLRPAGSKYVSVFTCFIDGCQ